MAIQLRTTEVVQDIIHFTPMAVLLIAPCGKIVDSNARAESLFGYRRDELHHLQVSQLLACESKACDLNQFLRDATSEAMFPLGSGHTCRATRKDGQVRAVDLGLQDMLTDEGPRFLCIAADVSGHQHARAALKASDERIRHVINNALDAVITMDERGCITDWNPQAERMFGWEAQEVTGLPLADMIIPEQYRESHWNGLKRYLDTGIGPALNRRLKLSAIRRSGEEFPIELTISALQLEEKVEFSAFLRDLSEHSRLEQAHHESEEQLRSMFHLASVGMVRIDAETARYVDVNQRFVQLTGYSAEELKAMKASDLTHPDDQEMDELLIQQVLEQRIPEYFNVKRYIRKEGEVIWVEINGALICDSFGQPSGAIAVVHEVTERKRAETALRASEERLKQAVNVGNFGIFEHDHVTNEIQFSQRMREIWEWPPDEPITIPNILQKLIPEDRDRIATAIQQAHDPAGAGRYEVEHRLLLPSGKTRWVRLRSQTFFQDSTPDKRPTHTVGAGLDISAEKEREAELQALANQLEQKVRERTLELTQANEDLRLAHTTLEQTAARLAMPARNRALERRRYTLEEFSLSDMMDCGSVIRSLSSLSSKQQFTSALVRYLYDHLIDQNGDRALALVRLFETRPYKQLRLDTRKLASDAWPGIQSESPCLTLLATAGAEADWNDVRKSVNHRVIPLRNMIDRQPPSMLLKLLEQLGIHDFNHQKPPATTERTSTGLFHIPDAVGNPDVPDQESFIVPHGIQSIIGFGEQMPDGRLFVMVMFSRVPITESTASLIGHLALSTHLGLLAHIRVPEKIESQILSLDRLLANHEHIVAETEGHLRETMSQLAASNAELEQFAYVASHDLQEPLRKIQAFADLLVNSHRDQMNDEGRDYLTRMARATERMQRLINDLLTLSRVNRKGLPFTQTNMNDIAATVLLDLEPRLQQSQGTVTVGPLPTLEADPTQMGQLLQNLISNGLKYMRPGVPPHVEIEAAKVFPPPHHHERHSASIWWKFTVRDNGIGFDQAQADRIFQPFQRLHGRGQYEGTGIGLTICRRIVDRHRGIIEAQGVPGEGSVFTVILPATRSIGE